MGFFSSLFGKKEPKKVRIIDDLQIEIVHLSPLANDSEKFMEMATFNELSKYFGEIKRAVFLGWGDPMNHPQFFEIVKNAKDNAPQVEIVTFGTKLDSNNIQELVKLAPDKITVKLEKTILTDLNENIKNLVKQRKSNTKVILEFIMTKDTIKELPTFIEQAAPLGVDEVMANNINFIISPEKNSQKVFEGIVTDENRGDLLAQGKAKGKEEYEDLIALAGKVADKKGVYFTPKKLVCNEAVTCDYNPQKNVFIAWNGEMSPCPYLSLKNVKAFFNETEYEQKPFIVGNILETNFLELWNKKEYADFRGIYERRVKALNEYMKSTFDEDPNAQLIQENYKILDQKLSEEKVPEYCAKCYKIYDV